MEARPLKMADVCAVTSYSRDQVRALLRDIKTFPKPNQTGKSRIFTRIELMTLAVIARVEQRYGLRRSAVAGIVKPMLAVLQKPREVDPQACLIIVVEDSSVIFTQLGSEVEEGLIVPLLPIFDCVDIYLGATPKQGQMNSPLQLKTNATESS